MTIEIIIEGGGDAPEAFQAELAHEPNANVLVTPRRGFDGGSYWTAFIEVAPIAIPIVIELLRRFLPAKRPTKIRVGEFEVENPTDEQIEKAMQLLEQSKQG